MLATALAVLLLAVAAVASGRGSASSTDEGVAQLDDAAATTSEEDKSGDATSEDEQDPEEAALAWAKCMREHGVDVPDPEVGEGGRLTIRPGGQGRRLGDIDSDAFREAQEACGSPFGSAGPPALSDEQREQLQETMLAFAKCMREHGVDMPDPEFSGGRGVFRVGGGPGRGVDPDNPTFQKAQAACQKILEDGLPGGRFNRSTETDAQ
jgi:hypothetical protein